MEEATRSRLTIANASRLHLVSRGDSVTTELLHESISVEEALAEIRAQTEAEALERQSIRREEVDQDVGGANAAGGGAVESARELDWAVDDGWIPKPARLHSGKTRYCAVCFAPLQYTTMLHWDEFLQSEEYLALLQENLLDDCFISSLICGDNSGGDLPTEHRMHKNRKLKCRQSVHDYMNMISAGVVDQWGKEKTSVRTLEEMLIYGLPTPIYTHVLERRLAVISHSTKLACSLMKETRASKKSRIAAVPQTHVELHHLAIHTLSALLQSFDYDSPHALQSFEEMSRLLMCFPTLSLFSFWSPPPKQPEKPLVLKKEMVEASSSAVTPRAHPAEFAIDGSDSTFWQSTARPGTVFYTIRSPQLPFVSSIAIRWHFKCHPQTVSVEFKRRGKEDFQKLNEVHVGPAPPQYFVTQFPNDCTEVRLAMSGMPATNRNATYAIEQLKLNVPSSKSMFIEPSETLTDVSKWLLGALGHSNEDVVIEAVATLKSWSLATASLSSVLLFVNMLLKLKKTAPVLDQPGVGQYALDQSKLLSESVHTFFLEEKNRRHRFDGKKKTNESRKIRAFFEPAVCSAGVTIEEGGTTVRTRETSYQYAAVNAGISSGKASWKFRLDNDTVDDEMTCFGAAILPVTVSGYDSSPSLWMLRGYNGNLYARGHKLSRSIGKVHPGDTVEINVDMTEGTLAYKINDTEHGVVFTDLLGHEVYPAVSFYGSGKVITLLGVHKWDDSTSGSTVVDPVYLSSLKEYHFSVGYGLFSKGNTLGYAQDDGFRGSASLANSAIHIGGEPKQRCLSTHPPSRGDAVVLYDLAEAYDRVTGAVAINGDVRTETLQQRGVIVSFSIIGDGKVLWQSKPVSESNAAENFDVSVQDVRMLELRVTCPGSNHCAHAIWVDPCLYPLEEWPCSECSFSNRGSSKSCSICKLGSRELSSSENGTNSAESALTSEVTAKTGPTSPVAELNPFDSAVASILHEVNQLEQLLTEDAKESQIDPKLKHATENIPKFEEPFCRQPSVEVFDMLLDLLRDFRNGAHPVESTDMRQVDRQKHAARCCLYTLSLISGNLSSIDKYDVNLSELELRDECISRLRSELEEMSRLPRSRSADSQLTSQGTALDVPIQLSAAKTLMSGFSTLYRSPAEKVQFLLHLLRQHRQTAFDDTTPAYYVMVTVIEALSAPGEGGIINVVPFVSDKPEKMLLLDDWLNGQYEQDLSATLSLLLDIVVESAGQNGARSDDRILSAAIRMLKSYQTVLLSQAVEAIAGPANAAEDTIDARLSSQRRRNCIQENTLQYSAMLLATCRRFMEELTDHRVEQSFVGDSSLCSPAVDAPLISQLLPWFVSCMCLLRRQTWLAKPILPALTRLLGSMDQYCSGDELVNRSEIRLRKLEMRLRARMIESQELERLLSTDKSLAMHHRSSRLMYNVFQQLYTGDKDHFEGQIGFQFEATSSFSIVALGRSVNPAKNAGRLVRQHTIRLWEEATQTLVAQATVSGSSRKDSLGYVFEPLSTPAKVTQGKLYRLTTQEFANGGDPWYKKENLPDEEYDSSYIRILRDCYASGSSGFPNSQNLTGAAYGVPTFLVEGENPFDSLSSCSPPDGSVSLKFNTKRKLSSVSVSHSGTTANVIGDTGTWRNCFLQTALVQGSHSIDFIVKSVRAGGVISGHVCIGIEWSGCVGADRSDGQLQDPLESFLGESLCSIGWMPSIGALWVQGKRVSYGVKTAVVSGDVLTMAIDFDQQTIAFSHNGKRVGTAVTTRPGIPAAVSLNSLPTAVIPGVSIFGSQDVVQVRPSGIAKSTLTIHWLLDLHNALASLSARVASTLVCGHPIDCIEEELLPWLQSPLLSGGILNAGHGSNDRGELSDWHLCLQQDYQKYPSKSGLLSLLPDMGAPENKTQKSTKKLTSDIDEATKIQDKEFIESFTKDMSDSGPVQLILRWLEKSSPDRSFLSRLGKFPRCERLMCAALIKHAPVHVIHETQAILSGAAVHDLEAFLESVNLAPSEDLVQVWKRVITFRHWLIKTRQEYRARASDDVVQDSNAVYSSTVKHEGIINNDNPSVLAAFMELEEKFSVPKTFEVLLEHVCQRAEFLCALEPPSEDRDRLGADSQTALSNLAEKWSSQNTPPALQPMLERWRTLKESDSSKWSGMVNVLRAQHRWRTRRSSITSVPEDVGDSEVDSPSQPPEYKSTFTATMKACDLYIRNGIGAPPEILQTLLERRQKRSESRIFGLEAMKCIMSMLSYDSARHNAIIFLRPSLRGFTDDEKESRDQNDGQVISESFRATVRHHYLKGLEGCNRFTVDHVEKAFWDLYAFLASLLIGNNGDALDSQLRQALICAWSIDFEPRDHPHLLKSGIISALHNEFSIESVMKDSAADEEVIHAMNPNSAKRSLAYTNVNWYPLSEEYVQQSVLHSGHVTKRDILRLLFQAPPCAYTQNWWTEHGLTVTEGSSLSPISKHTASSMALLYADMLKRLQMKLGSNWEKPLGRKALQFGMSGSSSNHNSTQPKPEDVSFIETPSLGEFVDFTIEMWVYPVELGGYRALRCDNGLGVGSVYLELMDRNLHFAVNGNSPRELLFKQCHFHTHAWTHVAVVYNKSSKSVKVVLNGRLAEEKFFDMVQPTVHLRTARMGCWLNTSKIESPPTTNTLIQRIFKGSIAEVRVWRVARLINHIRRDRSRSIPLQSGEEVSQPSKHLAALWHLNEGEGVCGYNHVSSTAKPWKEDIESSTSDLNSKISSCHWATMNVPVVSNASIDAMDDHAWQRFLRGLVGFQRRMRYLHRQRFVAMLSSTKLLCEFEEKTAIVNKWQHFEEEDDCTGSIGSLSDSLGNLSSQELQLLEGWSECTDEHIIHRKQTRRCAWIVFRVLTTVGICGIYERREAEAKLAAAMAKLKRKQRSQKLVTDSPRVLSPVNSRSSIRSGSDPARAAGMSYEEEDIQMRTAEAASDAAKLAATNRDLEEPVLQTLWFSIEFHRKVFEVIEKELLLGTALAQDTEGLTRAQRMLRSISTPLKRPGGTMRTHTTFVDSDKAKFGLFRPPMSTSKEALEPLEIEIYMFGLLTFMLSQSNSYPALGHLSKPRVLRELLQLLRLGSPRSQRLVKLLLRSVCRNGIVKPADVKDLLGSESIFIDLLLDQVAESVCSTAAPLPTHAVSVPANVVGQGASAARTVSESLSNPIGFRSGQIYLALASESVALLRLLLRDQHWQARVSELLCVAIRSIAPMMKRSNGSEDGRDKGVEMSDIRMRAAIIRAVGALCVLGSHTDCMRIGGRVEVTAKESTSSGSVDYGFNFSDRGVGPTLATLIELNSKASTARVVFEDTSEDSEPGHNVQEVNLSSVSPVEEIHLSSSTIPLTIDMMPVILQLSSLEESEVMSSFDDLWRLQIRSRALLAFEAIMRHSISMAKDIIRQAMSRNLLSTALTPIGLNTFVSLPFLQERGRMILCRLIESSTPLGPAMFYGLKDPKLPVPEVDDNNDDDSHSADMHNNPGEEETEEYRVRRGFASTLAAMGFEFDLCMAALEQSRNDPNLAVEWLMGGGAAAYQERQRAHRLTAYHIAQKAKDSSSAESELSIEVKARELESISGMPYCLAFCALELSNGDPNRAMEWLMEHGTKYTDKHENMVALSDAFRAKRSHALSDAAALEDVDQPDSLVANPRIESQVTSSNKNTDSSNIMAVTLAPILAPAPTRPSKGGSVAQIPGFAPLDPNYLTPHVLLTVSNDVGPVQRLSASGRTGIFRRSSSEDGILVTFLNTETGAYEDEWHSPKDVRRLVKIYDEPMKDVSSIHKIALRTENALSTHYARRVVTAILNAWDAAHDTDAEAGRSISIMNAMGGPRQFVNFVKLIAASDMAFSREPDGKPGGGLRKHRSKASRHLNDSPKTTLEELPSLLETVQTLVLEILDEEADSGRLRDADWLWRRAGEQSPRLTSKPNNADTMSTLVDTSAIEDEDDEEALCQAIALSIREAAVAANTESVSVALRDEEQKDSEDAEFEKLLHSQNPRALRVRQPSYNEAQDVARAYLGGSVDDHDGLLSSVLVKECVSHFVESTRVAGEGVSCDSHEPMEFQSLHPYFGRCDYTRAVSASTSSRCLRIVFDERCKLGPKAKLSLYSDAECTDRIALIEAANTADDKPLADIIVHGHEFWFRFVATEDDPGKNHGYGFRFQVRPMSSISWSNEKDVLTNPSLEWACWVLGFLLNDAGELVSRGAVHNRKIYGALVRYLRSPGAPFKTRVVRLLLQLLHRPELFPRSEIPDLEPLEAMGQLALVRARNDKESGKVFLSAHLLQLVELSIVTKAAAKVFAGPVPTLLQPKWPLSPPPLPERKGVTENLEDVAAILGFLLGERQTLPNDVLVAIWLDACGASAVIESNHPYTSDVLLHGVLEFPGAQSLLVSFDKRCATAEGVQLELVGTGSTHVATGTASSSVRTVKTFGGSKWPAGAIDIPGQSLEYTFMGEANPETHYGITVSITAEGIPRDKQLARAKQTDYHAFLMKLQSFQQATTERRWTPMMDAQLVDWVNINVESGGSGSTSSVDMKPSDVRFHPQLDALRCSTLLDVPLADVQLRFALLKHLNQNIKECISLLDLRDVHSTWTLAYKLRQLSHCIFFDIKNTLVESAIEATTVASDANGNSNNAARITLDRLQALESRDDREVEPSISECFFAQAFRQLNTVDPSLFRRKIDSKGRLFSVKFRGEEGVDWGGVYREGANSMVDDLFSQHFSLFVLCPNGQHDTGINRGMYLPNPKCTSPVAIQMFEFVGKLLGISLRTHGDFPFSFPSLVWKQLINQPLDRSDLEGTDAMFVQMLDGIQNCERDGIFTEEEFVAAFEGLDLRFTAFDCTGREVELVEGGRTKRVTFANRLEYCSLAERYRLYEGAAQVAAMVRGFATVSAVRVLTLLTWQEMEMLTCGSPKIDINHWKQHTRYDGYTENDETVKLFWEAMASFTDEQRSDFVRFAWGRSRLPRGKWPQPFKLTKKGGRDSTMGLPVAHTCFFSVELPPYTTIDKMRNMLLATINFGLGGILMA